MRWHALDNSTTAVIIALYNSSHLNIHLITLEIDSF